MRRRWRSAALLTAAAGLVAVTAVAPAPTDAAWVDAERGTGTFTAGVVAPPTSLQCAGLGIGVGGVRLTWTLPTTSPGSITPTSYVWTVTPTSSPGLSGTGTLAAGTSTLDLRLSTSNANLSGSGTGTFTLRAVGPGAWQSTPVQRSISITLGLVATCSAP